MKQQFRFTLTVEDITEAPTSGLQTVKAPDSEPNRLENCQELGRAAGFTMDGHAVDVRLTRDLLNTTLIVANEATQGVDKIHFAGPLDFQAFAHAIDTLLNQDMVQDTMIEEPGIWPKRS